MCEWRSRAPPCQAPTVHIESASSSSSSSAGVCALRHAAHVVAHYRRARGAQLARVLHFKVCGAHDARALRSERGRAHRLAGLPRHIPALVGYRFSRRCRLLSMMEGSCRTVTQLRRSRRGQPLGARRVFQNSPPYYGSSMGDLRRPFGTDAPRMPEVYRSACCDDPRQAPAGNRWRPHPLDKMG